MMQKLILLIAIICFSIGGFLLITAKSTPSLHEVHVVFDTEDKCNDDDYPDKALNSLDENEILAIKESFNSNKDVNRPCLKSGDFEIKQGESLHSVLKVLGISSSEIHHLAKSLKPHLLAKDISAGDLYSYELSNDEPPKKSLVAFSITKINQERIPITYTAVKKANSSSFNVDIYSPQIVEATSFVALTIAGSMFDTFKSLEYGNELLQRVLSIFYWRLRLPEQVIAGDKVEILVSKKFVNNTFIGYGRIISARYVQVNQAVFAIHFRSADGVIDGLFDENGISLEKELLVSPVKEATATSNQQLRLHPIRKVRIPHNGTDYRGTIGTPFYAIGDGVVVEKTFDKNVGNMVRIRHKYGVYSEYFHAHTLANNYSVNDKIKKGQQIGTIGRTGRLCTGPHLHLGLYKKVGDKRKYISLNSLRKTLAKAPDIAKTYRLEFMNKKNELLATIEKHKIDSNIVAESNISIK